MDMDGLFTIIKSKVQKWLVSHNFFNRGNL